MPAFVAVIVLSVVSAIVSPAPPPDAFAVMARVDQVAARPLWPGFDLRRVPVAIYDGTATYLFRHPSPPPEFTPVDGRRDVLVAPGQHSSVRANTAVDVAGVLTATYMMPAARAASVDAAAAVVAHEAFHVYQRQRYPAWTTNEGELFTYPMDDEANLAGRKLEAGAWAQAAAAPNAGAAACWAEEALRLRAQRSTRLPAGAIGYERGVELYEGTAFLVQMRAGDEGEGAIGPISVRATEVRRASYGIGRAMGQVLDRLAPGWERRLEAEQAPLLDAIVESALGARGAARSGACGHDEAVRAKAAAEARAEVADLRSDRDRQRQAFENAAGWRVRIIAGAAPLGPRGFDPMNLTTLGTTDVLHRRFVKLGNDRGSIEALDRAARTRGVGPHPLFNGVAEVEVTGFADRPRVSEGGGEVTIEAKGFRAAFRGAAVEVRGDEIVVRLPG